MGRNSGNGLSFLLLMVGVALLVITGDVFAHERWILTPTEVMEWNNKPKPEVFTRFSGINAAIFLVSFLVTLAVVHFGSTRAAMILPELQNKLRGLLPYTPSILRFCLAWALISSAFAMEPRVGAEAFTSPTLLAPDLELALLAEQWQWLLHLEVVLGVAFLMGIWVRFFAVVLAIFATALMFLFGQHMLAYLPTYLGVAIFLLISGPGRFRVEIPAPHFMLKAVARIQEVPDYRAQMILRVLVGLNFMYLGIYFKVLQPNLILGIVKLYEIPVLSWAPETFVLIMSIVETVVGFLVVIGILIRPLSLVLLFAFFFFATVLPESYGAHILLYGVMFAFLTGSRGHWRENQTISAENTARRHVSGRSRIFSGQGG